MAWLREQKELAGVTITQREIDSFWSKVQATDVETCWVWTAGTDNGGYGIMSVGAYPAKVHRVSWELHVGPIPDGLGVLHTCDNRVCVNPYHLFLGTTVDNTKDRDQKGRQTQGEKHHDAKMTAEMVIQARKEYKRGASGLGIRSLALKYGVAMSTMSSILKGDSWKGVKND
jgi:hypothetical protein